MGINFRKRHYAECPHCHDTVRSSDSDTFIDTFFLPKMCPNCGSEYPSWVHVVRVYKRVPGKHWWNFATWKVDREDRFAA